jgi:hypothetical protein
MASTSTRLQAYIAHSISTVQGYLSSLDAHLIASLLSYQDESDIKGSLCEIGVHHGRLFFMLALARREGERSLAIDLFEDDEINRDTPHAGRDRALLENGRRLRIELSSEEIHKTSSLDVTAADILNRARGQIRFFSIDGSHLYNAVENDLRLAAETLTGEGIIAVDDFFNQDWADASFATYDFLRRTDAFVPFAISSKLYLAPPAAAENYMKVLSRQRGVGEIRHVQILGRDILAFKESLMEKGFGRLRELVSSRPFLRRRGHIQTARSR